MILENFSESSNIKLQMIVVDDHHNKAVVSYRC